MSKCNLLIVTSCKGGVGKSTIAANLAAVFASGGKKTLLFDFDFNMRCLDLVLGLESNVIYNICDVIDKDVAFEKAVINDSRLSELYFCAAPFSYSAENMKNFDTDKLRKLIIELADVQKYEYIIIDTAADIGESLRIAVSAAGTGYTIDTALIATNHSPTAIRAAERSGELIDENNGTEIRKRLIVNNFNADLVKKGDFPGIIDIIDRSGIQLIGVIPFDLVLTSSQVRGKSIYDAGCTMRNTAVAFKNIAARLDGFNVPLLQGFRGVSRKVLLR